MNSLRFTRCATTGLMAFALATVTFAPRDASAGVTLGFYNITNNNAVNAATAGQYSVTVLGTGESFNFVGGSGNQTVGAAEVLFVFQNSTASPSSITGVYFQDGTLIGISEVFVTAGVSYDTPATPPNLPGGDELSPINFKVTAGFSADPNAPPPQNGVNASTEAMGILFTLENGKTFTDVITAIETGFNSPETAWNSQGNPLVGGADGLRIGIRVQAFANGGSEAFVNNGGGDFVAPEPSTIAMALTALVPLAFAGLRRLRRRPDVTSA